MTIAKPKVFDPEVPPPGFEKNLVDFWEQRRFITPRMQLAHTNGASTKGTVASARRWAMMNANPGFIHGKPEGPSYTTIPHLQLDYDGTGALLLPSNRLSITNARANTFALGFETADTGYLADPTISAFSDEQEEALAVAFAYYSVLHHIPLRYPETWDGSGTACHTEPFGYPYWTNANGKICPGMKKKYQVKFEIIPEAARIVEVWTRPVPDPTPIPPIPTPNPSRETDIMFLARNINNKYELRSGNGTHARIFRSNEYAYLATCTPEEFASYGFIDPVTGDKLMNQKQVALLDETQLDIRIGYLIPGVASLDEG